jgi:alpha-glucosidase
MTDSTARTFTLNTSFLPDGNYVIEIWEDAKDAAIYLQKLQTRKAQIKKGSTLTIKMAGGGGFAAIIKPM